MKRIAWIGLVLAFGSMLLACGGSVEESQVEESASVITQSQTEIDEALILQYLDETGLKGESLESGLYYEIVEPGGEEKPLRSSLVTVNYTGTTLDGKVFDSTEGKQPLRYPLAQFIEGWKQGIPLVGRGGKVKLFIPSDLAYGARQMGPDIAPNSVLIFEIELVDFE